MSPVRGNHKVHVYHAYVVGIMNLSSSRRRSPSGVSGAAAHALVFRVATIVTVILLGHSLRVLILLQHDVKVVAID